MSPDKDEQEIKRLEKPLLTREQIKRYALILLAVWSVPLWVILIAPLFGGNVGTIGQTGDSFGMINAAFSALAFAGVIYTILLQHKELALQRLELKETRKELQRSADAQEKSEHAFGLQAKSLLYAARINALASRIEAYTYQIEHSREVGINSHQILGRLNSERHSQIAELDKVMKEVADLCDKQP